MKTLERRLAETLRHEAERLPDEEVAHTLTPVERNRSGFLRPGMAAPAAVVAVMVIAAPVIWLSAQRGDGGLTPATNPTTQTPSTETSQPVANTTPDTTPAFEGNLGTILDSLPPSFDLEHATPLFVLDAGPEEVALRYLDSRHLLDSVAVDRVEEQDGYILVQWAWGRLIDESEVEEGESGWLVLRSTSEGHEVLAATTDGVDLSQIVVTGNGHILGGVTSSSDQHLGVDVLNLDGTPVDSAPNPEGMPDADFLWGTAASGASPLGIDIQIAAPAFLRVNMVGGALLSISEVILGDGSERRSDDGDDAQIEQIPEPTAEDWTDLPGGLSVAVVEEASGRPRIWTTSPVQDPAPAPSTDIAYLLVPVSATEIAVVIPNPDFFVIPGVEETDPDGVEQRADGQPERARIHWGYQDSEVDTVDIDWESDPRFGLAFVGARELDIVDVEFVADP